MCWHDCPKNKYKPACCITALKGPEECRAANLVESERIGFHIHYRINTEAFNNFGINIKDLLKPIKFELKNSKNCEFKGQKENCNILNK